MPRIAFTNETKGDGSKFLIKPGKYVVRFTEYKFGVAQFGEIAGSEQVSVKLNVTDTEWVWDNIIFHPKWVWRASAFLLAFGIRHKEGEEVDFNAVVLDSLLNRECAIEIKNDTYTVKHGEHASKTRTKNAVKAYIPQDEASASKPAESADDLSISEENIPF